MSEYEIAKCKMQRIVILVDGNANICLRLYIDAQ